MGYPTDIILPLASRLEALRHLRCPCDVQDGNIAVNGYNTARSTIRTPRVERV